MYTNSNKNELIWFLKMNFALNKKLATRVADTLIQHQIADINLVRNIIKIEKSRVQLDIKIDRRTRTFKQHLGYIVLRTMSKIYEQLKEGRIILFDTVFGIEHNQLFITIDYNNVDIDNRDSDYLLINGYLFKDIHLYTCDLIYQFFSISTKDTKKIQKVMDIIMSYSCNAKRTITQTMMYFHGHFHRHQIALIKDIL